VLRLPLVVLILAMLATAACDTSGAASPPSQPVRASAPALCRTVVQEPDQGNAHVVDLNQAYSRHPATSGPHYPVPLPPQPAVYTAAVPEARAVHNLEHGYVWVYYQPAGPDALSDDAVSALRSAVPSQRKVLMAPYPSLPAGASLGFAAWDELQQCGQGVGAVEALANLAAFVQAYREGPLAPEPAAG
jgi:hypothetical protein